jgi:hypothetical protein
MLEALLRIETLWRMQRWLNGLVVAGCNFMG